MAELLDGRVGFGSLRCNSGTLGRRRMAVVELDLEADELDLEEDPGSFPSVFMVACSAARKNLPADSLLPDLLLGLGASRTFHLFPWWSLVTYEPSDNSHACPLEDSPLIVRPAHNERGSRMSRT